MFGINGGRQQTIIKCTIDQWHRNGLKGGRTTGADPGIPQGGGGAGQGPRKSRSVVNFEKQKKNHWTTREWYQMSWVWDPSMHLDPGRTKYGGGV